MYVLQSRASRVRCSIPGTWYGTCKHPTHCKSEVRESVSGVKTPCEQGLPHHTYVLRAEERLPHATEEKGKRSSPMGRGPTAKHHLACNPQCTQWFGAEEFPLVCPTPKVTPCFSLGDVGKDRWPLSHRWTDTSLILPDAANDSCCLLYTSPSPRDRQKSRMPSSA